MSKKLLKLVLFTLGVLFFTGGACPSNDTTPSNKVAQSEIYQSYSIRQEGQNYEITAYLRIGGKTGTTLALIAPSKITFNGQSMQEHLNTTSGTYYSATVPNNTANGTFEFTDRNGKTYVNKIELSKVAVNTKPLRTNGVSPIAFSLSRPAADTNNFNLEINNQTIFVGTAPSEMNEAYFDKAKNSIVVMPSAWKKVSNGNVEINLEVRNSIPTQQGTTLGGDISFNYDSTPFNVSLVKGKGSVNNRLANSNTVGNSPNSNTVGLVKEANTNVNNSNKLIKKSVKKKFSVKALKNGA